jgi:hypothetical protein
LHFHREQRISTGRGRFVVANLISLIFFEFGTLRRVIAGAAQL